MSDNLLFLRGGEGVATAFVHPATGLATAFRRLVTHLPGEGPVFAFENLDPTPPDPCSIGGLAADYWSQLRPETTGPLVIAGWSFGGPVACEIAALAEREGHAVDAVVLIDSGAPEALDLRDEPLPDKVAEIFDVDVDSLRQGGPPASVDEALERVAARLCEIHGTDDITSEDLSPVLEVYRWVLRAFNQPWAARPCAAEYVLVRARDEQGWRGAPEDLGWSALLDRPIRVEWTPGTHYSLLHASHAPSLAELFGRILVRAPR